MGATEQTNQLRIGVLLTSETQMLDLAGIDLFGMISTEYLSTALPKPIVSLGLDVKIWYIGKAKTISTQSDDNLVGLTAQAKIKTTASIEGDAVQPGSIDILFIPGPDPASVHDKQTLEFVRGHARHGTTILIVCTGCFIAAEAGILDGCSASGPRALVPSLRTKYPEVIWDDKRRFIKDIQPQNGSKSHEIWSSGGITNGLEMVAAYLKEKYPGPLSETVVAMADVGDKCEFYDTKVSVDNAWWLGQIIRALLFGRRR